MLVHLIGIMVVCLMVSFFSFAASSQTVSVQGHKYVTYYVTKKTYLLFHVFDDSKTVVLLTV